MMNAKEYLEQVSRAEKEVRVIQAKIDHYRDVALSMSSHFADAPIRASTPSSRVETVAVGIVDALEEWNANLGAYKAIIDRAEKLIDRIPQERYRLLLKYRYLCGWDLQRVGRELQYTDRNSIYRAHGWALLEMGKILEEVKDND